MKNITISMDDATARWVRVEAAERDMSVSKFIAEVLLKERVRDERYQQAMKSFLARPPVRLRDDPSVPYPRREELYDRPRLR